MPEFKAQAELLKKYRAKSEVTQSQLAKHLKLTTPQYISNMERGLCPIPLKHVKKLCKFLDANPKDFFNAFMLDEKRMWRKSGLHI